MFAGRIVWVGRDTERHRNQAKPRREKMNLQITIEALAAKTEISEEDAERVIRSLDPKFWGDELPSHGGFFDNDITADKTAGHTGWWLAWEDSGVAVAATNGDPEWLSLDCEEDITAIGGDWDDVSGWLAANKL
jgi:hypothetical protein